MEEPLREAETPEIDSPRFEIFIDWAIRGSEQLRAQVHVSEEMFVRTHGQAVADTRAYLMYSALDETQKAGMHLIRLQELWAGEEVSPTTDRMSRLLVQAIAEEVRARERRLVELLVNLVLFATTNELEYYRHLFMIEELEELLRANEDLDEFHGARSANLDASISRQVQSLVAVQQHIDFRRTWYLDPRVKPLPGEKISAKRILEHHARLSSMRQRVKLAMPLMTPSEKLCTGLSYGQLYGGPSEAVHFSTGNKAYLVQAGYDQALATKLGLIVAAILVRVHSLLGTPATTMIDQLQRVLHRSDNENASSMIEALTNRGLEIGDFVLANGHLAEILEARASRYGTKSYRVMYLAEKPLPDVPEDWFPAQYIRPYFTKTQAHSTLREVWERHSFPPEDLEKIESDPEKFQNALRSSITELWPLLKGALRAPPKINDEAPAA